MSRSAHLIAIASPLIFAASPHPAVAQSLYDRRPDASPDQTQIDAAAPLYGVSLYAIQPPQPRTFQENDLVTIVVSEIFDAQRDQKVELEKDYTLDALRVQFPELIKFLAFNGDPADVDNLARFGMEFDSQFDSEAKYERGDRVTGRITARVLDVKPNGTLLLEARSVIQTDDEKQTFLLSGYCRTDDITERNTVQSNQLFDLTYEVKHEGEMRRTTRKGIIPRALETLFNF